MNLAKTPIALCRRQDQVRRDDGAVEPITQPGRRPFRQRTPGHPTRSGPAHPSRKPAARPAPRPSAVARRGVRGFSANAVGPWRPAKWTGGDRVSPGSRPKPQPPAHAPRRLPDRAEPGHPAAGSDRAPCRRSHRAGGCARTPSPPGGAGRASALGASFIRGAFVSHHHKCRSLPKALVRFLFIEGHAAFAQLVAGGPVGKWPCLRCAGGRPCRGVSACWPRRRSTFRGKPEEGPVVGPVGGTGCSCGPGLVVGRVKPRPGIQICKAAARCAAGRVVHTNDSAAAVGPPFLETSCPTPSSALIA